MNTLNIPESTDWKIHVAGSYRAMVACAAGSCVTLLPESVLKSTGVPPALKTSHVEHADIYLIWRRGFDIPAFQNIRNRLFEERA